MQTPHEPRPGLSRVHLAIGLIGVLVFLATGQYMDRSLAHLDGMADGPRALYRSGHIYILLSALHHLLLGAYVVPRSSKPGRTLQLAASVMLSVALGLFVYGFVVETPRALIERPLTRAAIELSLAGTLLHCLIAVLFEPAPARERGTENASHGGPLKEEPND